MAYVLGIDVSTTATKAVLIDEAGAVARDRRRGVRLRRRRGRCGASRTRRLWWDGAVVAIGAALARGRASTGAEVAAVGLTGQMHGLVLLDAADAVLRPAILWNDQRTGGRVRRDPARRSGRSASSRSPATTR